MSGCTRESFVLGLRSSWFRRAVVVCVAATGTAHAQASVPPLEPVRVVRIDGDVVDGAWIGIEAGGALTVRASGGAAVLPAGDVMSITFTNHPGSGANHNADSGAYGATATFFLAGGGQLPGAFIGGGSDGVLTTTVLGESVEFPFARLAGMRLTGADGFAKSEAFLQSSLRARLPGQDMLITRDAEAPKLLRGRLVTLGADRGSFTLGQRTRTFKTERIYALVFASGVDHSQSSGTRFDLADGSYFSGKIESANAKSLTVSTSLGTSVQLPLARVNRIGVESPRVVYVSDLTPVATHVQGRVHRGWAVAFDRTLMGEPLAIGASRFAKGIGCHSRTELRYELSEPFEMFVAEVGIDNDVRPRGSVEFRVLGDDDAELFATGLLTGRDEPVLVRVNVRSAKSLTLIVGYGDELDIADHAVWGGARLLRR